MREDHYDLMDKSFERRITTTTKPLSPNVLFIWTEGESRVDRFKQDEAEAMLLGSAPNQWPKWIVGENDGSPLRSSFDWFKQHVKHQ